MLGFEAGVVFGRWQLDVVPFGQGEEEVWFESALKMEVLLAFWKSSEELMNLMLAHDGYECTECSRV